MSPEHRLREQLLTITDSWLETPFRPHSARKGAGADCIQLVRAIYIEAGVVPETVTLPTDYTLDQGHHNEERSPILAWLERGEYFSPVPLDHVLLVGDLLAFRIGRGARSVHHLGILTGRRAFIHCVERVGTISSALYDPTWWKRLHSIWRPRNLPEGEMGEEMMSLAPTARPCKGCGGREGE